ncbi:hypothetical protein SNE40_010160 [Patella caerulea]|uniref:Uncharacterized protein n=1 Tax=Patella caerulea TaxID=87958 RepID=A0AAN8K080_PATCE
MKKLLTEKSVLTPKAKYVHQPFCLKYITIIARIKGLITVIMLWVSAILRIKAVHNMDFRGGYMLAVAIVVTFFELTWIIDKSVCCRREGCCCTCWSSVLWVDIWKRGILYVLMSTPMLVNGTNELPGLFSGLLLLFLSFLHVIKTFKIGIALEGKIEKTIDTEIGKIEIITDEKSTQTDNTHFTETKL